MADFRLSDIDQQILDKVVEVGNSTVQHTRYYEDHEHETPPARLDGEVGFEAVFPLFGQRKPDDTPLMTFMMAVSMVRGSTNGVVRGLGWLIDVIDKTVHYIPVYMGSAVCLLLLAVFQVNLAQQDRASCIANQRSDYNRALYLNFCLGSKWRSASRQTLANIDPVRLQS